jgi:hypothetical protein
MPTLPTKSLFDKDLSLRSPFPRHISNVAPIPGPRPTSQEEARFVNARTDYSQIKRPTPVKAKSSPAVFESQLPREEVPHSLRNFMNHSVCEWR